MSWERRSNGKKYYYRTFRKNGRVGREYYGNGLVAQLAEELHQRDIAKREANRQQRQRLLEIDAQVKELCKASDVAMRATLWAAGYYQHARGEWRIRHGKTKTKNADD